MTPAPGTTGPSTAPSLSPRSRPSRIPVLVAVLAIVGVVVAGCSSNGASGSDQPVAQGGGAGWAGADSAGAANGSAAVTAAPAASDGQRQVVRNGELYLTVADPLAAADRVAQIADRIGGRVDERQQDAGSDGAAGSASMTIRVPTSSLDATVAELHTLGDVTRYQEKAQDVTGTVVDLDARITAAQTSVDRVQGFLEHTSTTTELLATEQALSQRQAELEQLRGQRAALADQVAMSTLYVLLTAPGHPAIAAPGPRSFAAGVGLGWRSLLTALRGVSVALGVLLPWLVLGAVLAAAIIVPIRRRHRTPAPAPAAGPPAAGAPATAPAS